VRDPVTTGPASSTPEVEPAPSRYPLLPFVRDWANTWQRRAVLDHLAQGDAALRAAREELQASVVEARAAGATWQVIGTMIGISGEGVRRRFAS